MSPIAKVKALKIYHCEGGGKVRRGKVRRGRGGGGLVRRHRIQKEKNI